MQAAWRLFDSVFVSLFVLSISVCMRACVRVCVSVDEEVVNDERVVRLFTSPGQK